MKPTLVAGGVALCLVVAFYAVMRPDFGSERFLIMVFVVAWAAGSAFIHTYRWLKRRNTKNIRRGGDNAPPTDPPLG